MQRIALFCAMACMAALPAVAAEAPADERVAAYRDYRTAFDAGQYEQALPLSVRIVELTANQFGNDAPELVNPLTNLATTLYRMKEYGEALDAYRRALTILDANGNAADARLVAPLHGLGATLHGMDRDEEAVVPLKRAVDIIRNRDGLQAPSQLPILRALIASYEQAGRNEDASREHQYAFNVAEKEFGRNDPRMIEPLAELARWYESTGRYTAARLLYIRAVQLADAERPNNIKAVSALRGMARTYRLAFINGESMETAMAAAAEVPQSLGQAALMQMGAAPSGEGERALRNALQRLESAGSARAKERGEVLLDLGDWYRIAGATQRAMTSWREGWDQLSAAGDTSALAQPVMIIYRTPNIAVSQRQFDPEEYGAQEVQLRVAIATDGAVRDVTVANPSPQRESAERTVASALRRATWRPAFAGGVPIAVNDFVFREQVYVRLPESAEEKK